MVHKKLIKDIDPKSLNLFPTKNQFRQSCLWLVEWKIFQYFITLCVLTASVILFLYDFNDQTDLSLKNKLIKDFIVVFNFIFVLEVLLKVIAWGLMMHPKSYLQEWWNIFDCLIAFSSLLGLFFGSSVAGFSRTMEALRTLRLIKLFPTLKELSSIMWALLPQLFNVGMLLLFILMVFAMLGKTIFIGRSFSRCRLTAKPLNETYWPLDPVDQGRLCSEQHRPCSNEASYCKSPFQEDFNLEYDNIFNQRWLNYGLISFDTFGQSLLTVFQSMTLQGWSGITYNYMDSYGKYASSFFFSILVLFCNEIMLNMVLAVIIDAFAENAVKQEEKAKENEKKEEEAEKERFAVLEFYLRLKRIKDYKADVMGRCGRKRTENGDIKFNFFDIVASIVYEKRIKNYLDEPVIKDFTEKGKKQTQRIEDLRQLSKQNITGHFDFLNDKRVMSHSEIIQQQKAEKQELKELEQSRKEIDDLVFGCSKSDAPQVIPKKSLEEIKEIAERSLSQQSNQEDEEEEESKSEALNDSNRMILSASERQKLDELPDIMKLSNEIKSCLKQRNSEKKGVKGLEDSLDSDELITETTEEVEEFQKYLDQEENINPDDEFFDIQAQMQRKKTEVIRQDLYPQSISLNAFQKVHIKVFRFVDSWYFSTLIMFFILFNSVVLASEYYGMSERHKEISEEFNYFFINVFFFEMVLKVIAYSPKVYIRDKTNLFDAFLVIIALIELILQESAKEKVDLSSLIVLRGFRIFRVLKLASKWKSLQNLIVTLVSSLIDIFNIVVIFFMFLISFTLLGVYYFGQRLKFDENDELNLKSGESPRANFDDMLSAITSVFIVIQGEDWQYLLYDAVRSTGWQSSAYFIILVTFGQIILLNLVIAVLIESFDKNSKPLAAKREKGTFEYFAHKAKKKIKSGIQAIKNKAFKSNEESKTTLEKSVVVLKEPDPLKHGFKPTLQQKLGIRVRSKVREIVGDSEDEEMNESKKVIELEGRSLNLFSPKNNFRRKASKLVYSMNFEAFILLIVTVSSVVISLDNPLHKDTKFSQIILYLDFFLTFCFFVEFILKIIVMGFAKNGQKSYLRDTWNVLDFIILICSVLSYTENLLDESNSLISILQIVKLLRLLKAIRPLRIISKNDGLKIALKTLMLSIPSLLHLMMILFIFFTLFGIFMMNVLKGALHSCYKAKIDPEFIGQVVHKWDCLNLGGTWDERVKNFDTFLFSIETFYDITSGHRMRMLWAIADHVSPDYEPQENNSSGWIPVMIVFIMIFGFFFSSLYIGVVVSIFDKVKEKHGKYYLLTSGQKNWLTMKTTVYNSKPLIITCSLEKQGKLTVMAHHLVNHLIYKMLSYGLIFVYTVLLVLISPQMPKEELENIETTLLLILAVCFFNQLINFQALRSHYLRDNWNRMDFFFTLVTALGFLCKQAKQVELRSIGEPMICALCFRLLRLASKTKLTRIMIDTFLLTFPSILNVGSLLMLIIYIFAVMGMQLFALNKLQDNAFNYYANFQTLHRSFFTLMRSSTGEAWDLIRNEMGYPRSILNLCIEEEDLNSKNVALPERCGSKVSNLYFFAFSITVSMIFLNLFIAIIIQGFTERAKSDRQLINYDLIRHFQQTWSKYDDRGKGFIRLSSITAFLYDLGPPLGFPPYFAHDTWKQFYYIKKLHIPTYDGVFVNYHDLLESLANLAFRKHQTELILEKKVKKMEEEPNEQKLIATRYKCLRNVIKQMAFKGQMEQGVQAVQRSNSLQEKRRKKHQKQIDNPEASLRNLANVILGNQAVLKLEAEHVDKNVTIFDILNNDEENTARMTPKYFRTKRRLVFGQQRELVQQIVINYANMVRNCERVKKWWGRNMNQPSQESGESEVSEFQSNQPETEIQDKKVSFGKQKEQEKPNMAQAVANEIFQKKTQDGKRNTIFIGKLESKQQQRDQYFLQPNSAALKKKTQLMTPKSQKREPPGSPAIISKKKKSQGQQLGFSLKPDRVESEVRNGGEVVRVQSLSRPFSASTKNIFNGQVNDPQVKTRPFTAVINHKSETSQNKKQNLQIENEILEGSSSKMSKISKQSKRSAQHSFHEEAEEENKSDSDSDENLRFEIQEKASDNVVKMQPAEPAKVYYAQFYKSNIKAKYLPESSNQDENLKKKESQKSDATLESVEDRTWRYAERQKK